MKAVSLTTLLLLIFGTTGFAQTNFNLTLEGQLTYQQDCNDIWGWRSSTGTEYAIVGTRTGTSIVSLANPASPTQVQFIPGASSTWRDIKTNGNYAYVTTDVGQDGLLIIDLSGLPGSVNTTFWRPELTINGTTDTLNKAHNLYIDENGTCIISGSNINNGEPFFLDITTNATQPSLLGFVPPIYAHDVYARGDTVWTSDIYAGAFSGYDMSNKASPVFLGGANTPDNFTHNAWISDDGNTLFTTDERANAYIGSYDVSDMGNVSELDRWRPYDTENNGVIPHNVHVFNDYLVISYYTDGLIIVDASRPDNLVKVGQYDTYLGPDGGFNGCWGATPFLPSGTILASDIDNGLFVFTPNYQRACWLEGVVTDSITGSPIFDAFVEFTTTPVYDNSKLNGEYKTGYGVAGTYDITFSKAGYVSKTITVNLQNGVVNTQNVELVPLTPFSFSGQVFDATTNDPIANATVVLESDDFSYNVTTNAGGNFTISSMFAGNYEIYAGKWGHKTEYVPLQIDQNSLPQSIFLEEGYRDEFALDLGWQSTGTASSGLWTRANSEFLTWGPSILTPNGDLTGDIGEMCYISGDQDNGSAGNDDIDGGTIYLDSPVFDVSSYIDPYLSYYAWFVNVGGGSNPDDSLIVKLFNGSDSAVLAVYDTSLYAWTPQQNFKITDYLPVTNTMWVQFEAFDKDGGHIVEVAVDLFEVVDSGDIQIAVTPFEATDSDIQAFPNPFSQEIQLDFAAIEAPQAQLRIFNQLGQLVHQQSIEQGQQQVRLSADWPAGIYHAKLGQQSIKIIKKK